MTLLIDGHNLIGVMPGIDLADPDDEWQLLQRLRPYAAAKRQPLTVVFDSGIGPTPQWRLSDGGVTVRFAPPGVEADAIILQLLRASPQPGAVTVITNAEARPDPRAPAFADIYHGFVEGEKDQARFGAEIDLDAEVWIERLYGDDLAEAARAARWLGRFGGPAGLDPLLDALSHRAGQVRAAALLALADLGDPRAVQPIALRLAQDDSSMAREAAAQALGRLGGAAAEHALQAALADPKAKVRRAAAASLAQMQARLNR